MHHELRISLTSPKDGKPRVVIRYGVHVIEVAGSEKAEASDLLIECVGDYEESKVKLGMKYADEKVALADKLANKIVSIEEKYDVKEAGND